MTSGLRRLNLRAELRRALLAAMESCWLYTAVYTISTLAGQTRQVSPFGIFLMYWVGLVTGRLLPRSTRAWRGLQLVTILIALITLYISIRIGLYGDLALTDLSWIGTFSDRALRIFERVSPEELAALVLIFAFIRALTLAQSPLTLWVVGYQFRLGIVIFFGIALISAFTHRVDFVLWIFVYFAVSLLAIALARIQEGGQEHPLGWRWAVLFGVAISATLALGWVATHILTLDAVNAFFAALAPLAIVIEILIAILAIPILLLVQVLLSALAPLFDLLRLTLSRIMPQLAEPADATLGLVNEVTRALENWAPYLRLAGVALTLAFLGWLIAQALNRRLQFYEQEMFTREADDEREGPGRASRRKPRPAPAPHREIHAENVRRIYAALQAHAESLGLKRREAETPLEFLPRLSARFPEVSPDLRAITEAYVAVHYAQQPATDTQVRELRAVWNRVRSGMRLSAAHDPRGQKEHPR